MVCYIMIVFVITYDNVASGFRVYGCQRPPCNVAPQLPWVPNPGSYQGHQPTPTTCPPPAPTPCPVVPTTCAPCPTPPPATPAPPSCVPAGGVCARTCAAVADYPVQAALSCTLGVCCLQSVTNQGCIASGGICTGSCTLGDFTQQSTLTCETTGDAVCCVRG